jgi:hypothetical protein
MKLVLKSSRLSRLLIPLISLCFITTPGFANTQSAQKRPARPPANVLINIDFNAVLPVSGPAAIGYAATDYWNGYSAPYQSIGQLPDLHYSDGQLSGASLTVQNAPGAWDNEHPDSMMRTFVHSFAYQPILVTLDNLPNGTYDIYVYAHGVLDQNSIISAEADGVNYGTESTSPGADWQSAEWIEGAQYVVLRDVSVLGGSSLVLTSAPGLTEIGVLNGIQLLQTSTRAKKVKPSKVEDAPVDALLNLDFGNTATYAGEAAGGNGPADIWNSWYAPFQFFAEKSGLIWATGEPSVMSATIENAPGAWVSEHPDGMMNTFTHSFEYQPIVLTLSDLPNGTYDIYVYAHGVLNQNSRITAMADGVTYGPESTTSGPEWLAPGWTEGTQYVLLEKVSVLGGSTLVIRADAVDTELAVLSGIQLRRTSQHAKQVKAPKPTKIPKDALLNVDLANPAQWTGVAATGDGPADIWNGWYAPYQFFAQSGDLKWSNGDSSGATASIQNAPGAWWNGHPDLMMSSFAHSFGYQPILLTFTDLPIGTYDVYVYAHGVEGQDSSITAVANEILYGPENTTVNDEWMSATWSEGAQYVRLQNVVVPDSGILTIQSAPISTELAVLNGIQLRRTSKKER